MGNNNTRRNVLIAAILLGLFTSLLVLKYLSDVKAKEVAVQRFVVVTTRDIPARTILEPGMLRVRPARAGASTNGYLTMSEEAIGKVTLVSLPAETPIKAVDVASKSRSLGLAYDIPEYMRAVTVAVDPVIGVAGFLKPGDKVDVLATFRGQDQQAVTKTVIQDVKLLAYGPNLEQDRVSGKGGEKPSSPGSAYNKTTATLLVTPAEAEKLVLAESEGKLRLALRAAGDMVYVNTKGATRTAVTGLKPKSNSAAPTVNHPAPAPRPLPVSQWRDSSFFNGHRETLPAVSPARVDIPPLPVVEEKGHEIVVIRGTDVQTVEVDK